MQDELKAIQRRIGTTFVHVTHDQEEAMAIADKIVVMNQGRIDDVGAPSEIYMRPRSLFSAGFMGEANFLRAKVQRVVANEVQLVTDFGFIALATAAFCKTAPEEGAGVTLCIRPEHFRVGSGAEPVVSLGRAEIVENAFFGTHQRCHARLAAAPETTVTIHLAQTDTAKVGDIVNLSVPADRVVALG